MMRTKTNQLGILFEDINLSADGGIYPKLIRNRSFEDADTLQYWKFESADGMSTASISTADVQDRPPVPPLNPFNRKSLCDERTGAKSLCASASRDEKSGDIILKIVNADFQPLKTRIDLKGVGRLSGIGKAIVLTSASPLYENTLEDPARVSPKNEKVNVSGTTLVRSFTGNSLTVLRIPTSDENKQLIINTTESQ